MAKGPDRWSAVERVYHEALGRPPERRAAFVAEVCAGNEELRREVESLLAQDASADPVFTRGAAIAAAGLVSDIGQSVLNGRRLGAYQILGPIGSGGMGEVYRARDTRLGRDVAIKVLPRAFTADPDRLARFEREARVLASLNHQNIATIHGVEEAQGIRALVMELVDGTTLAERLADGRLPMAEALAIARQIADALEAAHEKGIVHRDLKPANIKITPDGIVKVLDFGLAKVVADRGDGGESLSPTVTIGGTREGLIVGTAAYMSPEQARGLSVDRRTDIFSLGVVLYEMLAGQRPFRGASQIETMHAIINDPPPPLSLRPELQDVLDKTVAKDPKDRYQHAGDVALDLRRFLQRPPQARHATAGAVRGRRLPWIAAVVFLLALPLAWWAGRGTVVAPPDAFESVSITPFTTNLGYNGEATIAPDNQTIAYVSDRNGRFDIFLRQIGTSADIALTDQGDNIQPAFSPDGRQIAFVSSRAGGAEIFYPGFDFPMKGGDIWVMPALGGTPRRIAKDGNFPSWSADGTKIVFARDRIGVFEVPASGGDVHEIKMPGTPQNFYYPVYSSDSQWVFVEATGILAVPVSGGAVQQIATGRHPVWDASSQAVIYSDSREGKNHSLWSVPFSTKDGKGGTPRPLTIGRGRDWQPAVSKDGKLVAFTAIQAAFNLESVPFDAEAGRVLGPPRVLTTGNQVSYFMRFSPDGQSVVFESSRGAGRHIWRVEMGGEPVQLTSDPKFEETFPQWSPDGTTIAFTRQPAQSPNAKSLWLMDADGANPRQILEGNNLTRWLPDGSELVYQTLKNQIFVYDLASRRSRPIATQPDVVTMPTPSPDAKWIVYQSTSKDAGKVEVHAVGLDGGQPRLVVSTGRQDFHPFFSPSGRWVYFQPNHKNLYRVPGPAQEWQRADPAKMTDFPESGLFLEDPQISRDGKQLLYSRGRITGDIWILTRSK